MKSLFLSISASALLALSAAAQTSILSPVGDWPLCEDSGGIVWPGCEGFVPGTETYMLLIGGTSSDTAYQYVITATLSNGAIHILQGTVARDDSATGWTAVLPLVFGGVVESYTVAVNQFVTHKALRR